MRMIRLFLLAGTLALVASCASFTNEGNMNQQVSSIQDLDKLATPNHDSSMYPEAKDGQERILINLPKLEKEGDYEIELFVGKWAEVDCNRHSLMGEFEETTIEGWGYNYFTFKSEGDMMSTRMACPNQELERKLINAQSVKVRYSSKFPIVIFVPEGYTVNYKLWNSLGSTTINK